MDVKKKHVSVGRNVSMTRNSCTCNWDTGKINFNGVLAFELVAYPPSMFNEDGKMNVATSKSTLKHKPQVNISECNCPISDTRVYYISLASCLNKLNLTLFSSCKCRHRYTIYVYGNRIFGLWGKVIGHI